MDDKLLSKVRALLAKADSSDFPAEAEAFREHAQRLIVAHGLQEALRKSVPDKGDITQIEIKFADPFSGRKAYLLHVVAQALGCQSLGYQAAHGSSRVTHAVVVGFPGELEQVELIYTMLLLQGDREAVAKVPPGKSAGTTRGRRSSFLLGFAVRAGERLEELYKSQVEELDQPGAALVLVQRADQVTKAFNLMFDDISTTRSSRYRINDFEAGMRAANTADIGQPRFRGGSQRELIRGS